MLILGAHRVVIADDAVLRRRIGAAQRHARDARDARYGDDLPAARADHARQQLLGERDGGEQVDRDDPLIKRKVGLDRKAALRDARVVDEAVDAAAPRPRLTRAREIGSASYRGRVGPYE